MNKIFYLFTLIIMMSNSPCYSKGMKKRPQSLKAYGKIGVMAYGKEQDLSIENIGSRIGLKAKKLFKELHLIAYARGEWSFNAVENSSDLSIGADYNVKSSSNTGDAFRRRLGFLGFKSPNLGDIRVGKQWSVYTDVSHFTDSFNLYGGSASGTYNLNTDGGQSGTGRISKGITYRKKFYGTHFGLQAKLIQNKNLSINGTEIQLKAKDSFGFSIKRLFSKTFELGLAYNQIEIEGKKDAVTGYDGGKSYSAVLGFKFILKNTMLALTLNKSSNHEMDSNNEIFNANGAEIYINYDLTDRVSIYGGYNALSPSEEDYTKKYRIQDYLLGTQFKLDELKFFFEGKLTNSKDTEGKEKISTYGAGIVLKF